MLQIYPYRSRRKFEVDGRSGGVNVEKTWTVKTEAVGKSKWIESPYLIANEWISANIANFLRLPIPSYAIVGKKNVSTRMFTSYSYDGDVKPDDVIPEVFYKKFPHVATGIVMLDVLIANCDRNGGNLKVDKPTNPSSFYIIDHERALFYIYENEGVRRLEQRIDRLGISDSALSRDDYHCLVELIDNVEYIKEWIQKIQSIPDWFLTEICDEVWKISITKKECEAVKSFLIYRKNNFHSLIYKNKSRFINVKGWPLFVGS